MSGEGVMLGKTVHLWRTDGRHYQGVIVSFSEQFIGIEDRISGLIVFRNSDVERIAEIKK